MGLTGREYFAPTNSARLLISVFGKACSFVAVGVVPLVKTKGSYMAVVVAVDKACLAVVTPRSCQVYAVLQNTFFLGEVAVVKNHANLLAFGVGWRNDKTTFATILAVNNGAVFKQTVTTSKDEIYRTLQCAIGVNLLAFYAFT